VTDEPTTVRVRRAPKFGRFAIIGGAVGAIATFIATALFPADPNVGFWSLFAYFALYGVTAGVALGALLALLLDAILGRRARTATAQREDVVESD
jgi:gas vesicle protein